jgi:hypothetical protein
MEDPVETNSGWMWNSWQAFRDGGSDPVLRDKVLTIARKHVQGGSLRIYKEQGTAYDDMPIVTSPEELTWEKLRQTLSTPHQQPSTTNAIIPLGFGGSFGADAFADTGIAQMAAEFSTLLPLLAFGVIGLAKWGVPKLLNKASNLSEEAGGAVGDGDVGTGESGGGGCEEEILPLAVPLQKVKTPFLRSIESRLKAREWLSQML